jgi:hypothetical protein
MNLRTPSYFTVSHTRRTGGVVANSYSSRSCVWGVTARSILYAIRNGAIRCRPPLDTGAPTKARSHIPLSSHFVSNEWLSLSVTRRTRPSRPASSRCPPIADVSTHRRDCSQASAWCSFFSIRSPFQWSFSFFSPSDVRLQARTEICRFPRPSFLTRSGSRPQLLSSSSSPLWAAPAPSAFPARSGAQPLPAAPHQARSGVRRSCGPPTCLARVSSRGPPLRHHQPSGSVLRSTTPLTLHLSRCSRESSASLARLRAQLPPAVFPLPTAQLRQPLHLLLPSPLLAPGGWDLFLPPP